MDYILASESVALDQLGFTDIVDIKPGQAVIIPKRESPIFRQVQPELSYTPDIFEYCYFARLDSIIDDISFYLSRQRMGIKLAETIRKTLGQDVVHKIDVVIPIPESGIGPALSVAKALNLPYRYACFRNCYIFRTFVMPTQENTAPRVCNQSRMRCEVNSQARMYSSLMTCSVVRGTTSVHVCLMAREVGAKNVYFASSSPPVTHTHIYGIDLATLTELVAYKRNRKAIAKSINADEVIFISLEDLEAACAEVNPRTNQRFEVGVFCGMHVTPVSQKYLESLETTRGKSKTTGARQKSGYVTTGDSLMARPMGYVHSEVGLHNVLDDQ